MSNMGLHHPFKHLKHKLWSKERVGVKLVVWLPTTKSWESPQFLLKISQQGLIFCFRPHRNRRSEREVMGPQSCGSPNYGNFGTPTLESKDKKPFGRGPVERCRIYYKGEGASSPQVRVMVNLVSPRCPCLVLTPKVLQLCTNHLVLVLCRFVWVVEACQFILIPSRSSSMPFYPSKVLWVREHAPTLYSSIVFNLDSRLSPSKSWERIKSLGLPS
jgi:hypothetical protein